LAFGIWHLAGCNWHSYWQGFYLFKKFTKIDQYITLAFGIGIWHWALAFGIWQVAIGIRIGKVFIYLKSLQRLISI
jgi:hypothetical protein